MELIRFRVLTKVEQINDNLFLNTCKNEFKEVIRNDNEVKRGRAGSNVMWGKHIQGYVPLLDIGVSL
jgi:hypothetical protein